MTGVLKWCAVVEQVSHHPLLTAFHLQGRSAGGTFAHYGSTGAEPIFCGNYVEVRMIDDSSVDWAARSSSYPTGR